MASVLLCTPSHACAQVDVKENQALEAWLAERSLDELLLEHLESQLESSANRSQREEIATRIATLYGKKLLALDGDAEALLERTRTLIQLYPRFADGRLRVAILHARYLSTEKDFRAWIRDGANVVVRNDIESKLKSLYEDLSGALSALLRKSEELYSTGQLLRDRRSLDVERQAIEAEAIHCQFLAGWTGYFLAILQSEQREILLDQSDLRFREFLQLDQQTPLTEFDSSWFDFASLWHVRAMAGLAAIALARNETRQADHLYSLIEANAVSRESRESAIRFRTFGLCYSGQFDEATKMLSDHPSIKALSSEGKIRLWIAVSEAANAAAESRQKNSLTRVALLGLTRQMAGEILVENFDVVEMLRGQSDSFESNWILGYVEFYNSENGKPESALLAKERLQKAIALSARQEAESTIALSDVARCRYVLAWLELKTGNPQVAVGIFRDVAETLAEDDPRLASEADWLAAKAAMRFGNRDPQRINDAWTMLERFVRKWPNSPRVAAAEFEKLRIELRSMPPAEALERLNAVSAESENYGAALLEIASQRYRMFQAQSTNESTVVALRQACEAVTSSKASNTVQKLRATYLLVDALLRSEQPDKDSLIVHMKHAESMVQQLGDFNARIEWSYYQMQMGQRLNDLETALEAAKEIVASETTTRFELPALILVAQSLDRSFNETDPSETQLANAVEVYKRLSESLGQSEAALKDSANARVAFARLGELQQAAGQSRESGRIFSALVELFPGNASYLRNLAVAKSAIGDSEAAKNIWKRIASGSEAGSELWFESKLAFAKIVAHTDREAARQLIRQTIQLGGEMTDQWQSAYASALDKLEGDR